ncbi:MAG: guanylate kinase [Alphaproteobacteria bacterium]|nr:guanylate kinase [Alphaproteobacteria bacterium]MCZ6586538.1 guanylate kinase [Alphaproteobacteria bacterium]MCZ6592623.1 guanylate kinase [Alphaproteobacteria bacterium]MCZ6840104.1 guanylate kinase [Alphaproteobacteria bacterium]MCZ6845100.1 guanylate kinase [Alphaproteobacteria bacterium]
MASDTDKEGLEMTRRGLMLVLSSPSGAGKTSISRELLERDDKISLSISATTRPRRPGEVDGEDYKFVDKTTFDLMINRQELLEHAKVFDHYYGTPRAPVEQSLAGGRDVLFDIDWQGTQQLAEKARGDLVSIFILPPSTVELDRRLHSRAQDSEAVISERMARAADEMTHWSEYDYVIVNVDFDKSVRKVQSILEAERLKRPRLVGLSDFVTRLRQGQ